MITTTPSTVVTTTPTTVAEIISPRERWYQEVAPNLEAGADVDFVFTTVSQACDELRAGGRPATETFSAMLPAQLLVENYGINDSRSDWGEPLQASIPILCPDQTPALDQALSGTYSSAPITVFGGGKTLVGSGKGHIAPGTWQTSRGPVQDCYWERSDTNGNIIENNNVSIAPSVTVTILPTDGGFTSNHCGPWKLVQ